MKKVIKVGSLTQVGPASPLKSQIIAFRSGKTITIGNMEWDERKARFEFDDQAGTLTLKLNVNDGDFVVLDDVDGMVSKKQVITGKPCLCENCGAKIK